MNIQTGIIDIRGKQYKSVALRVQEFRQEHPDWSLTADVVARDEDCVVMKATVSDQIGRIVATGHAEEYRKSSQINRTSALENAETSAIGRALAAAGYGGTEFASANEVENAIYQQGNGGAAKGTQPDNGAVSPSPLKQQLQDSVEASAKDYPFPPGPASGITALKGLARTLWREIEGCGDDSELDPLLETDENKALLAQLGALEHPAHRQIWEGDGKDNPGIAGLINRKRAEFQQLEPNILRAG